MGTVADIGAKCVRGGVGSRSEGLYIPHPLGNPCTPTPPIGSSSKSKMCSGLCDVFGLVGLRSGYVGDVGYVLDNLFGLMATVQYIGFESVSGCSEKYFYFFTLKLLTKVLYGDII